MDRRAHEHQIEGLDADSSACVVRRRETTIAIQRSGVIVDGPDRFAHPTLQLVDEWFAMRCPSFADWRCLLTLDRFPSGRFWRPYRWTIGPNTVVVDG